MTIIDSARELGVSPETLIDELSSLGFQNLSLTLSLPTPLFAIIGMALLGESSEMVELLGERDTTFEPFLKSQLSSYPYRLQRALARYALGNDEILGVAREVLAQHMDLWVENGLAGSERDLLSSIKAGKGISWTVLVRAKQQGRPLPARVVREAKSGFEVDLGGHMAFLPDDQVEAKHSLHFEVYRAQTQWVIPVQTTSSDQVVVSRKWWLEERWERFQESYPPGTLSPATVVYLTKTYAYIHLPSGLTGYVEKHDVARDMTKRDPASVLSVGQAVVGVIESYEENSGLVRLNLKRIEEDPVIATEKIIGQVIVVTVAKIVDSGLVVGLTNGATGLIYKSEIPSNAHGRGEPHQWQVGEKVEAAVVQVDRARGNIRLSIVKAQRIRWEVVVRRFKVGKRYSVDVIDKVEPGYCVVRTGEMQGIIHVTDLHWSFQEAERIFSELNIGSQVEAEVIEIDMRDRRVSFGIKQMGIKPQDNKAWNSILVGQTISATVLQVYENMSLAGLGNGICGQLYHDATANAVLKPEPGSTLLTTVLAKNIISGNITLAAGVHSVSASESQSLISSYEGCKKDIRTLDTELSSLEELQKSYLWSLLDLAQQEYLRNAFQKNSELFSPSFKSDTVLYVRFEPLDMGGTWSRFLSEASVLFRTELAGTPEEGVPERLLELVSKYRFWYAQYDDREGETKFNLFNEFISFYGDIRESIRYQIRTVKFKGPVAAQERQWAMRRGSFALDVPVRFLGPKSFLDDLDTAARAADLLRQKTEAFAILKETQREAAVNLLTSGKDFRHFNDYLDAQVRALLQQMKEQEFKSCGRVEDRIELVLRCESDEIIEFEPGDQIKVYGRLNDNIPLVTGEVLEVSEHSVSFSVRDNFDINAIAKGGRLRSYENLGQFRLQKANIVQFLSGESENCNHIYHALHSSQTLEPPAAPELIFFDENLRSAGADNNQRLAVQKAVGNKNIFLVQGPPGTGKTTVINEVVRQLVRRGERVLVTGQTHISVDNALDRMADSKELELLRIGRNPRTALSDGPSPYSVEEQQVEFALRAKLVVHNRVALLGSAINNENLSEIAIKDLVEISCKNMDTGHERIHARLRDFLVQDSVTFWKVSSGIAPSKKHALQQFYREWSARIETFDNAWQSLLLLSRDVILGTCIGVSTSRLMRDASEELTFDTVIVDEAGKANISETLTAIAHARKVLLVGDHKQLPPYIDREVLDQLVKASEGRDNHDENSRDDIKRAVATSLFEKLQTLLPAEHKIMLNKQFRMHPMIGNFISETFYEGGVSHGANTNAYSIRTSSKVFDGELLFFDTSSQKNHLERGRESKDNPLEAEIIVRVILPALRDALVPVEHIGVVTPYSGQARLLVQLLKKDPDDFLSRIEVSTLDSFQGRELDVIVFSFTRSLDHRSKGTIGFLDDVRRLNVALSRAKKKLILVGDVATLEDPKRHTDAIYAEVYGKLFSYLRRNSALRLAMPRQRRQ